IVYRDFAPLDSIVQASGRCNRNWNDKGKVYVVNLVDERRPFSSYIYDAVLLNTTRNILQKSSSYNEVKLCKLVNEYYSVLQAKLSPDTSDEFIDALNRLRYSNVLGNGVGISDFALIEQNFIKLDVFVEVNEEAKKVWERYCEIKEIKDLNKRREQFDKIKKDFYKFVISVPNKTDNFPPIVNGFGYVNYNSLSDYYDSVTGFKVDKQFAIW
ncbi:CRISPR-associated helicase/endonuclease Cas3, partial [bacterium]|nr:CRISPR-associated helicase/endonuclease Cas3 [bacterium]